MSPGQEPFRLEGTRVSLSSVCCEKLWWRWPYARVPVGQLLLKATRHICYSLALAVLFAPRRVA